MPSDLSVGISDLVAFRECPRRAAYGMQRHSAEGEQNHHLLTPEAQNPAAMYGSMMHAAIEHSEAGETDEKAIELAWREWGYRLGPEDMAQLAEDLRIYHERDEQDVTTVMSEDEIKVPLGEMEDGRPIWFRARIDRLYQRVGQPGRYVHVDYKSSKWNKSQAEVDGDLQMWAYNWALYEWIPDMLDLEQVYDQFRHGRVRTRKTSEQREEMRQWLEIEAREFFEAREKDAEPRFNTWCPYCPIMESCEIIPRLTDWARARIAALSPEAGEELTTPIDVYVERYDEAQTALKTLARYEDSVKSLVREMPESERDRLGFRLSERKMSVLPKPALEAILDRLGAEEFVRLASVTQESLKKIADPDIRGWALGLVEKAPGSKVVQRSHK